MSDLKPCPFCGNPPKLEESRDTGPGVWLRPKPWPAQYMVCQIRCCHTHIYRSVDVRNNDEEKAKKWAYELASGDWNTRRTQPEAAAPAIQQPQGQDRGIELAFMGVPPGRCPHEFDCDVAGANYSIWRCRHCGAERKR